LTITVADAFSAVFWVEVAVIVMDVLPETTGAVKTPVAVMEPAVAIQTTVVLKVPVPVTVAVHWIIWPD